MADRTGIEWTDATWNPIVGCSIVSPGCTHCYAMKMAGRIERMQDGKTHYAGTTKTTKAGPVWTGTVALAPEHILTQPLRWKRGRRICVNSMSDLFHEAVRLDQIDRVFAVMALCPQHTFQVLTKRPERALEYLRPHDQRRADALGRLVIELGYDGPLEALQWPLPNVWLGVSAEDQRRADERIPVLLRTPAAVRFVSCEPLLGPIDLRPYMPNTLWNGLPSWKEPELDWVIVGGESGPGARPMHPDWPRSLRDQCGAAGVPFFFKQWGEWGTAAYLMGSNEPVFRQFTSHRQWANKAYAWVRGGICLDRRGRELRIPADFARARDEGDFPITIMDRVGKKAAGRLLDGREWQEMPA